MKVKVIKWISRVVNILLVAIFLFTFALVISNLMSEGNPKVFGQELKVVYSGSMEPEIKTGAVIGIKPEFDVRNLKEGDVIMFQQRENHFVTHRIIEVLNNDGQLMFRTKGDNNEFADTNAVIPANIYGVHDGINIPYIGYAMDFANSKFGLVALMFIPGFWLLFSSGKTIYTALKEEKEKKKRANTETVENVS
ncbi:signal peptidase I SipW [Aquisalibacillus elongatus]|uniref:Signal peptidase I n=1 Tax=Aquisalibacillus elongatus TaxID=485577 RepID=A0A3N5B8G9_9BACI|nr:signal peptidase I [Aquisalibacillus elongatus]RPF54026.1 Signal peptidase I [Aquisalibacillus elongatus]